MAIQIPRGDNLGNISPQVGRTRLQGGGGAVGRAMIGVGREIMGIAARLEYDKEQTNQVEMRNAVLEREKQVNNLRNDTDQRIKMGELDPEQAVEEYNTKLNALPKQQISGLTRNQQETLNYYYNATDYRGQQQVFGIYQQGLVTKAQTAVSEFERLANENPDGLDSNLAALRSEAMQNTIRTAYGMKSPEATANIARNMIVTNLQSKSIAASDSGNYKYLKQLKTDVMKSDFYKGDLPYDDRVKISHGASVGIEQIDSRNKRLQAEAKQAANNQYAALKESIYMDMLNGTPFDQIDQNKLALLKAKDLDFFKSRKTVKDLDLPLWKEARGRVKAGEDFDILDEYGDKLPATNTKTLLDMQQDMAGSADSAAGRGRAEAFKIFSLEIQKENIKDKGELAKIWDDVYSEIDDFEKKNNRKAKRQDILNITNRYFLDVQLDNGANEKYRKLPRDQRSRIVGFDISDKSYAQRQAAASYFGLTATNNQVSDVKDIPPADKREIELVLKSLNIPVTDDAILKYYYDGQNL